MFLSHSATEMPSQEGSLDASFTAYDIPLSWYWLTGQWGSKLAALVQVEPWLKKIHKYENPQIQSSERNEGSPMTNILT